MTASIERLPNVPKECWDPPRWLQAVASSLAGVGFHSCVTNTETGGLGQRNLTLMIWKQKHGAQHQQVSALPTALGWILPHSTSGGAGAYLA